LLATRVTRGLFARLVPAAADKGRRGGGKEKAAGEKLGDGDGDGGPAARALEFGGEGGDEEEGGVTAAVSEQAAAEKRREEEREEKIKSVVASMGFVELLFWSSHKECEQMRESYHLNDR